MSVQELPLTISSSDTSPQRPIFYASAHNRVLFDEVSPDAILVPSFNLSSLRTLFSSDSSDNNKPEMEEPAFNITALRELVTTTRDKYVQSDGIAYVLEHEKVLEDYLSEPSEQLFVRAALWYMYDKMRVLQIRDNGEPASKHPIDVCSILLDLPTRHSAETVAATLLHDVVEDCYPKEEWDLGFKEIEHVFGFSVKRIVDGLTKLDGKDFKQYSAAERDLLTLEHGIRALADDPRVLVIKWADRLISLLTLDGFKPKTDENGRIVLSKEDRQRKKAEESSVYIKLFRKLGLPVDEMARLALFYADRALYDRIDQLTQLRVYNKNLTWNLSQSLLDTCVYGNYDPDMWNFVERAHTIFFDMITSSHIHSIRTLDYLEIADALQAGYKEEFAVLPLMHVLSPNMESIERIENGIRRYNFNTQRIERAFVQSLPDKVEPNTLTLYGVRLGQMMRVNVKLGLYNNYLDRIDILDLIQDHPSMHSQELLFDLMRHYGNYFSQSHDQSASTRVGALVGELAGDFCAVLVDDGTKEHTLTSVILPSEPTALDVAGRVLGRDRIPFLKDILIGAHKYSSNLEDTISFGTTIEFVLGDEATHFFQPSQVSIHKTGNMRDLARERIREWSAQNKEYREFIEPVLIQDAYAILQEYLYMSYPFMEKKDIVSLLSDLVQIGDTDVQDFCRELALTNEQVRGQVLMLLQDELDERVWFIDVDSESSLGNQEALFQIYLGLQQSALLHKCSFKGKGSFTTSDKDIGVHGVFVVGIDEQGVVNRRGLHAVEVYKGLVDGLRRR